MRHSTLELTGRYTRPRAVDIEAAASMLPSLKSEGDRPEAVPATGTDGRLGHRVASEGVASPPEDAGQTGVGGPSISKHFGQNLATTGDVSGCFPMLPDAMVGSDDPPVSNKKPLVSKGFEASRCSGILPEANTGEATRTPDLRIMRPPL
jgi:hypothetical protein